MSNEATITFTKGELLVLIGMAAFFQSEMEPRPDADPKVVADQGTATAKLIKTYKEMGDEQPAVN